MSRARAEPRRWRRAGAVAGSWHDLAEQSLRPQHQDDQHRQEQDDISKIGKHGLAEIVEKPDDETADQRAEQTAGAAENDDNERERQHVEIEARIDRKIGRTHDAGEGGKRGAKTENQSEKLRDSDADNARDRRIIDAGADHGAKPSPVDHDPERD